MRSSSITATYFSSSFKKHHLHLLRYTLIWHQVQSYSMSSFGPLDHGNSQACTTFGSDPLGHPSFSWLSQLTAAAPWSSYIFFCFICWNCLPPTSRKVLSLLFFISKIMIKKITYKHYINIRITTQNLEKSCLFYCNSWRVWWLSIYRNNSLSSEFQIVMCTALRLQDCAMILDTALGVMSVPRDPGMLIPKALWVTQSIMITINY